MQTQEVEKFQLLASTSLASNITDLLYFTQASSDTTFQEVVFLASTEARVNRIISTTKKPNNIFAQGSVIPVKHIHFLLKIMYVVIPTSKQIYQFFKENYIYTHFILHICTSHIVFLSSLLYHFPFSCCRFFRIFKIWYEKFFSLELTVSVLSFSLLFYCLVEVRNYKFTYFCSQYLSIIYLYYPVFQAQQ